MAERYTKLSPLDRNLYTPGSPVVILAGSLLRDNETGIILGQFKFQNISDNIIKALVIKVDAFDVSGKELPGVSEYQYLDLFARRGEEFGQKSAVILPESITRSVKVQCMGAVFADDTQWSAPQDAVWSPLPTQQTVADTIGSALAEQYRRTTTAKAEFMLTDHEDLWLCACGGINHAEEAECHSCGYTKTELIQTLDEEMLTEGLNKHREDMQAIAEEEEKEKAEKAVKAKKVRTGVIIGCATALIAFIILLFTVILPAQKARENEAYLEIVKTKAEAQVTSMLYNSSPLASAYFTDIDISFSYPSETITGDKFYLDLRCDVVVFDSTSSTFYFDISGTLGSDTFELGLRKTVTD